MCLKMKVNSFNILKFFVNCNLNTSNMFIFFWFLDKAYSERPQYYDLPFSLLLNISNKKSLPLFLMLEPDEEQHPPQTVSSKSSFGEYTTNSEQNSRASSMKGSTTAKHHVEIELGGDYKNDGQDFSLPRSSQRKRSKMSYVSFKSSGPKDEVVVVSSNSSESDRKHSSIKLNSPASLKNTFTVSDIYSDCFPKPEELDEVYDGESFKDDLSDPSCNDDRDMKMQLCLTDYCGRSAEDYFTVNFVFLLVDCVERYKSMIFRHFHPALINSCLKINLSKNIIVFYAKNDIIVRLTALVENLFIFRLNRGIWCCVRENLPI